MLVASAVDCDFFIVADTWSDVDDFMSGAMGMSSSFAGFAVCLLDVSLSTTGPAVSLMHHGLGSMCAAAITTTAFD